MAVRGDGSYCGYVSGCCTEAAVAAEAISISPVSSPTLMKIWTISFQSELLSK
jgi:xanthine/CO dehydrogenase XdhC/CoxF family maturation factor